MRVSHGPFFVHFVNEGEGINDGCENHWNAAATFVDAFTIIHLGAEIVLDRNSDSFVVVEVLFIYRIERK